jgi:MFS family permease
MPRLFLLELIVFVCAFAVSYLLRLIIGQRIKGPPVILWGALFGMIGALLGSYIVETSLEGTRFLWTDGNIWGILNIAFRFFLLTAIIGGVLGALYASLGRRRKAAKNLTDPTGQNSGQPPTK